MADYFLDCLGETGTDSLNKTQQQLNKISQKDRLIVCLDKRMAMVSILEWVRRQGYAADVEEIDDSEWNLLVKRFF